MKRSLILGLFLLLFCVVSNAHDFEKDGIYYSINPDGETVSVTYNDTEFDPTPIPVPTSTRKKSYGSSVVIPPSVEYDGKTFQVTEIGEYAFCAYDYSSEVESVTLPEGIIKINRAAFSALLKLKSIEIPESVKFIGEGAFKMASNLENISISDEIEYIASDAFFGTKWLNSQPDGPVYLCNWLYAYKGTMPENYTLTVKPGTVGIGPRVFYWQNSLISAVIPNTVKFIGEFAFSMCKNLVSADMPDSVVEIGESAFNSCSSLESAQLSPNLKDIPDGLFYGCYKLMSVDIPPQVEHIGAGAFTDCVMIQSINIPDSAKSIGNFAFRSCGSVTTLTIGRSVKSIGKGAFKFCGRIGSVSLPSSLEMIGEEAFSNCSNLAEINFSESTYMVGDCAFEGTKWNDNQPEGFVYAANVLLGHKGDIPSQSSILEIPDGILGIADEAFRWTSGLVEVRIPTSLKHIGHWAFLNCYDLATIINYSTVPQSTDDSFVNIFPCDLYVPEEAVDNYSSADGWKDFSIYPIKDGSVNSIFNETEHRGIPRWYDLRGVRLAEKPATAGIYIVRHADGTAKKVAVR